MDEISDCCTSEISETMCCSSACLDDHDRVSELNINFSGQLKINDENRADTVNGTPSFPVERYYIEEEEEEDDEEDEDGGGISEEALLAQMGYAQSDSVIGFEEEDEEDLSEDLILVKNETPKHKPIDIPTAELNLVSALKGSREKEGRAGEECRVSWAPDVYDPICTSDDHFIVSKNERHRVEHKVRAGSGKNRQKKSGSEGRGGGGKGSRGGGSEGGSRDKKKADKKHKKHKYSDPG